MSSPLAAVIPSSHDWDDNQALVIEAGSEKRLIVEAGPGTGKTAVACARLAFLVTNEFLEPSSTWMISFTRTAVAEIRARLHAYAGDDAFAIRIATVDSHAWSIHSGHDSNARLTGSYEENISRVIELIKNDEDVAEELQRIEHVIIDEAQDLVGERADLVEALIGALAPECGVTVFADEAQAIYGFSDKQQTSIRPKGDSLLERLRLKPRFGFETLTLNEVHRTNSPGLRKIFTEVRQAVLAREGGPEGLSGTIAGKIRENADTSDLRFQDVKVADFTADDLILFRTRQEVLRLSQFTDLPHRVRLSNFSSTLPAWIALCFYDYTDPFISEAGFLELWTKRIEGKAEPEVDPATAWASLQQLAGRADLSVDMQQLRFRLSRPQPPVEIATPEYGLHGPIVGTIHASKGRESPNVILLLPPNMESGDSSDEAEEARVLFVGATRARASLMVGDSLHARASSLRSGRTYSRTRTGKYMMEVGRPGDISASGLVGTREFTLTEAHTAQEFLGKASGVVTQFKLRSAPELDWNYRILTQEDPPVGIGIMSQQVNADLWNLIKAAGKAGSRPPTWISHVRAQGSSTLALSPDDNELELLHEPWASSGFMLIPRIIAYPTFSLPRR